jgi:hypothetical protein
MGMFALLLGMLRYDVPTALPFAVSFVFEVYVSSFLAIERPRDRI